MAKFIGREELVSLIKKIKIGPLEKGLKGELAVGELLMEYLPEDTCVIAHPEIGNLNPDLLVISPHYGFRIVEVKNMSIDYIQQVLSNGGIKSMIATTNPLNQVKCHVDLFNNFLTSNHKSFGSDHYREIGYCVVHYGFTSTEFKTKFKDQIDTWSRGEYNDFFKYHIFKDQLDQNFEKRLSSAAKFTYNKPCLTNTQINVIIRSIHFSPEDEWIKQRLDEMNLIENEMKSVKTEFRKSQSDMKLEQDKIKSEMEELKRALEKTTSEKTAQKKVLEDTPKKKVETTNPTPQIVYKPNTTSKKQNNEMNRTKIKIFVSVFTATIIIIMLLIVNLDDLFGAYSQEASQVTSTENIQEVSQDEIIQEASQDDIISDLSTVDKKLGETVRLKGTVTSFFYDKKSGTKFLKITDLQDEIEAVIFKGTDVIYVKEGTSYIFTGEIQKIPGEKGVEIVVSKVE